MKQPDPIGLGLQQAREGATLAVDDVVVKTGIARDRLLDMEASLVVPDASEIAELATLYEVTADELLGMEQYRRHVQELGRQLRQTREHSGFSVPDVLRRISLSERRLRAIEEGRAEPSRGEADGLASIYKGSPDALAGAESPAAPDTEDWASEMSDEGLPPAKGTRTPALGSESVRIVPGSRARRRKVAAMVVGALVLSCAGVMGKQLLWPNRYEPVMESLNYQSALLVLIETGEDEHSRRRALLRVHGSVRRAVAVLKDAAISSTGAGAQAAAARMKELARVEREGTVPSDLRNRILALRADLDRLTTELDSGTDRQGQIATQAALGLLALRSVARGSGNVADAAKASLQGLRKLLASRS